MENIESIEEVYLIEDREGKLLFYMDSPIPFVIKNPDVNHSRIRSEIEAMGGVLRRAIVKINVEIIEKGI